jgi:hypothetical protein
MRPSGERFKAAEGFAAVTPEAVTPSSISETNRSGDAAVVFRAPGGGGRVAKNDTTD